MVVGVGYTSHFFDFVFLSLWPVFFLITNHPNSEETPKISSGSQKQKCSGHFCVRGSKAPETAQNDDFLALSGIRSLFKLC